VPRSRCLPTLYVLLLASGCDEPTAPLLVPSTYVARTVNGASVPAPLIDYGTGQVVLLADTLHLYPLGASQRISIYRHLTSGAPATVDTSRTHESYEVHGDSLRFYRYCPPNANCVGPPEGIFSADRRTLLLRMWPSGPLVLYDRVTP
jgi:hypothetical protein